MTGDIRPFVRGAAGRAGSFAHRLTGAVGSAAVTQAANAVGGVQGVAGSGTPGRLTPGRGGSAYGL
ncbi:hypothetical protein [Streptomyces sp. NPDC127119]|uniref:hypothetical protein n=1 Tax=Streptomyces sp. NPDC127119 TaxID=3345370 RepID=UPI00362522EE